LALCFAVTVFPAGWQFFKAASHAQAMTGGGWLLTWFVLIVVTTCNILLLPYLAVVEGSGSITEAYGIRLAQGVCGGVLTWVFLSHGAGLWAAIMAPSAGIAVGFAWLVFRRRETLREAYRSPQVPLDWGREVWSLQWRLGLTWLSGYLLTQIYTPLLFYFQGPVVAGQMGLSLTVANMVGLLAQSWIARRVPAMAQAARSGQWGLLDKLFATDFFRSVLAFAIFWFAVAIAHILIGQTIYSSRILDFWNFMGLLGATFLGHINGALAAQLRSFRREPLVWVAVLGALITVMAATAMVGPYGARGVILTMVVVQVVFVLPVSVMLWRKLIRKWRLQSDA
jgi:hypothetical protein